ncbi:putative 2-phosphoglycerate kinase [Blattamonas nauphoetae]|uniref:2-phosphoglycerate kinase n=1 Tax=Blattamonas nauphoetae TaxID=2049346 RepID=A0ABQ9YLF2_9EUKA|nr:putative 2-phosphoglycerate kinase [Blattamonas nauphoetae]
MAQTFGPGSQYDYVKVKIRLSPDHYAVFSRFMISRFLRASGISEKHSQKIALELKKILVDGGKFDVTQGELDACLFFLLQEKNYTLKHFIRYRMIASFFRERVPLVFFISGTGCLGKKAIATKLANILNLPNVLHTRLALQIMQQTGLLQNDRCHELFWMSNYPGGNEEFIEEYRRQAVLARKGVDFDIRKAIKEGKPVIIEGTFLDPRDCESLFAEFGHGNETIEVRKMKKEDGSQSSYASFIMNSSSPLEFLRKSSSPNPPLPNSDLRISEVNYVPHSIPCFPSVKAVVLFVLLEGDRSILEANSAEWLEQNTRQHGQASPQISTDALVDRFLTIQDHLLSAIPPNYDSIPVVKRSIIKVKVNPEMNDTVDDIQATFLAVLKSLYNQTGDDNQSILDETTTREIMMKERTQTPL